MNVKNENALEKEMAQRNEFLKRLETLTELTKELSKLEEFKLEGGEAKRNWEYLIKKRYELTGQLNDKLTEISIVLEEKDINHLLSGADQLLEMIKDVQLDLLMWTNPRITG